VTVAPVETAVAPAAGVRAVTVGAVLAKRIEPKAVLPYIGAQLVGAIAAAGVLATTKRGRKLGALAGAVLDKLAATYLMLFLVMTDLGVVQSPMFRETPGSGAVLLPGYGPSRVMYDGAFSQSFHATEELLLSLAWLAALGVAVYVVLRRAVGSSP